MYFTQLRACSWGDLHFFHSFPETPTPYWGRGPCRFSFTSECCKAVFPLWRQHWPYSMEFLQGERGLLPLPSCRNVNALGRLAVKACMWRNMRFIEKCFLFHLKTSWDINITPFFVFSSSIKQFISSFIQKEHVQTNSHELLSDSFTY